MPRKNVRDHEDLGGLESVPSGVIPGTNRILFRASVERPLDALDPSASHLQSELGELELFLKTDTSVQSSSLEGARSKVSSARLACRDRLRWCEPEWQGPNVEDSAADVTERAQKKSPGRWCLRAAFGKRVLRRLIRTS